MDVISFSARHNYRPNKDYHPILHYFSELLRCLAKAKWQKGNWGEFSAIAVGLSKISVLAAMII